MFLFFYINYNKYNNLKNTWNEMLRGRRSTSLCRSDVWDFSVVVVRPVDSVFFYCVLCFCFHPVFLYFPSTPVLPSDQPALPPHLCSSTWTSSVQFVFKSLFQSSVPEWSWIKLPPLLPADFYFNLQHHILWDHRSVAVLWKQSCRQKKILAFSHSCKPQIR